MMKRIAAMLLLIAITVPLLAGFTYSPQQTLLTGDIYQVAVNLKVPTNNDIIWSLKKDGGNVNIPDHIQGSLGNTGGSISFMQNGYYTLTASVTDAAGRKFEKSSSVTVYTDPLLNCNFSVLSANQHISKNFVINIDAAANTGGKTISWSLTKSGVTKSYTGSLSNSGGSIRVSETGTFTLTSTITDSRGRTSTCSNNFTVYNNAPATPVISRTPGDSVINCNDQIRITATASDPDGDGVTLVWDNRPSEYATYAQGVHTVRVKARDSYGLESGWASTTLTSALLYQSGYIIPASAGMGLYIDAPVGRNINSVEIQTPAFTKAGGENYIIKVYSDNLDSGSTDIEDIFLSPGGDYRVIALSNKKCSYVRIRPVINDPAQQYLSIYYKVNFSNP